MIKVLFLDNFIWLETYPANISIKSSSPPQGE